MQCQCNRNSMDHSAGDCRGKATTYVKREKATIAVCADCKLSKDIYLRDVEPDE